MSSFLDFNLSKQMYHAIEDLKFDTPTPIQEASFSVVMSGKDMVGIAQTGTGKTFAYMLPILQNLKFSKQIAPRILVVVPTRELVLQVVDNIESYAKYTSLRVKGVYGGTNINTQRANVAEGMDVLVATPGRLFDLVVSTSVSLKSVQKMVIDEVDVMLDLGFRHQLLNIFDLLPERRQNIMFSATMTEEVDELINEFFIKPERISVALSSTPLKNIQQSCYKVKNFHTKANLLKHLLSDKETFKKVLVFVSTKKNADLLFEMIEGQFGNESCIIHSNKSQNYRIRSIEEFNEGKNRILVATDVISRGLDLDDISHVINFDTPHFPENYVHRIGRTGRAQKEGNSILFYTEKEETYKLEIELLMNYEVPEIVFPNEVAESSELIAEERPVISEGSTLKAKNLKEGASGPSFHEKKDKNKKENLGGSYRRMIKEKYKKPKTKGDKNFNKRHKKKK